MTGAPPTARTSTFSSAGKPRAAPTSTNARVIATLALLIVLPPRRPRFSGLPPGRHVLRLAQRRRDRQARGRAARAAGRRGRPSRTAKTIPVSTIPGVIRKANAISLKLWVWPVPVEKPFIGNASRQPIAPPITARNTDSIRNETQDRAAREAERAQRPDLARARGHDRVHRVHRAEHGADAHDAPRRRSRGPRACARAGPPAPRSTCVSESACSCICGCARIQRSSSGIAAGSFIRSDERVAAAAALEDGAEGVEVAPDLALEGAALSTRRGRRS